MVNKFGLTTIVAVAFLAGCSLPDESMREGAQLIPHQDVDEIPAGIRSGEQDFTGAIIYGDSGYTGLVGNRYYPNIRVDGLSAGKCEKRRAIIVPLEPGDHIVSAHSENTVSNSITLREGDVAYFRCNYWRIGGILFPPAILDPADADTAYATVNGG